MPIPSCCDRLTLRVVLLKVSPLIARLISVPDDLSLEELHDVLQLVFGWSGQAFYNFRIHGQEIGRRRHLRTRLLRQFQLRRREKFLYTYGFLDLWEWEIRVLDIEPGSAEASQPRCLASRAATPPEECGGPRGYMRILDQHKYYPPMAEQELVEKALRRMAGVVPDQRLLRKGKSTYVNDHALLASWLGAFREYEPTDIAAADHALIVDNVAADDFGHQGEIEVADFRIALGETMKHTICRLDRGQFPICRVDRPRLIA